MLLLAMLLLGSGAYQNPAPMQSGGLTLPRRGFLHVGETPRFGEGRVFISICCGRTVHVRDRPSADLFGMSSYADEYDKAC